MNIETYHNPITIDQEKMMTSLELAEAFGQDHKRVLGRLQKIIDDNDIFITGPHYGLVEYKDAKGEMRPMLNINFDIAFAFAITSRKDHAMQLVKSMFETRIEEVKSKIVEKLEKQAEKDKAQIKHLKHERMSRPSNVYGMSSPADRTVLHNMRLGLCEQGMCDHETKIVTHHYFPVTELGKENGYRNKLNGRPTIDLNYRDIGDDDDFEEEIL